MFNRFSIVIPSFNDTRILDAIDSINKQNFPRENIEIIIQDGGSKDNVLEEIKQSLQPHDRLIVEKDRGIFDGINKGICNASNELILTIGSDDRIHADDSIRNINELFNNNAIDYVCATINYTDESWTAKRKWEGTIPSFFNFCLGRQTAHFGFFCKKDLYEKIGLFNLSRPVSADFDFFLRVSKSGLKGMTSNEVAVDMKLGGNSSKNITNILNGNYEIFLSGLKNRGLFILLHFIFKPFWKVREHILAGK